MNSDDLGTCNCKSDEMRQKWAIHFNKDIYPLWTAELHVHVFACPGTILAGHP